MVRRECAERTRRARHRTAASEAVSCTTAVRTESFFSGLQERGVCGGFNIREKGLSSKEGVPSYFDFS